MDDICDDLGVIKCAAESLGLHLNHHKSEIIRKDMSSDRVLCAIPGASVVDPSCADLLGYTMGNTASIGTVIDEISGKLERLSHFSMLFFPSVTRLLSLYCSIFSSFFLCLTNLKVYDDVLRLALSALVSTSMTLPGCKQRFLWDLVVLGFGVECSWHSLPFWLLLLALPPSFTLSCHLVLLTHHFPTQMMP